MPGSLVGAGITVISITNVRVGQRESGVTDRLGFSSRSFERRSKKKKKKKKRKDDEEDRAREGREGG